MVIQENEQPEIGKIVKALLLAAAVIALPALEWSFWGWSQLFLPLLSFFLLSRFGSHAGKRMLLSAATLALPLFLALGRVELFLFSASLLFSGFILFQSAERHDSPALSGLKASAALTGGWLLVLATLSVGSEVSLYGQLLKTLDQSIIETVDYYRKSESVSAETLVILENSLHRMQQLIPLVMPAILGSMVLLVTWLNMVIGSSLRLKATSAWDSYRYWHLPEKLIWLVIVMGTLTLIPSDFQVVGVNSLILLGLVYCFQGLSILVFFMNRWNVPILLRSLLYVMIVFQSLGTVLLIFIGIADIWLDFRKQKPAITNKNA